MLARMNADILISLLFVAGIVAQEVIRFPHRKRNQRDMRAGAFVDDRSAGAELVMSLVAWACTEILPLFYVFTGWLARFDYARPLWTGMLGLAPLAAGTWLLWRAHRDLGRNWSPTLQVVQEHRLVTSGVYATLRHPIYTAFLLTALAQALMLPNWVAGPAGLVAFALLYSLRIPREEEMMHEHYGAEYEDYMQKVGGLLPRVKWGASKG